MRSWITVKRCSRFFLALVLVLLVKTYLEIQPIYDLYQQVRHDQENIRLQDRYGEILSINYQNHWNTHDQLQLYQIPDLLKEAFIVSEDQNFFHHGAIDWYAKLSALWQNIRARRIVRGASTITEQVVHMLYPRPRTIWSKWLECVESYLLEAKLSKHQIYEFYLNQLPYASNRRGISQGARLYFNRDISTLSLKEMLALVVMIKAPTSYDLRKNQDILDHQIKGLAAKLYQRGHLSLDDLAQFNNPLQLSVAKLPVNASHFVGFLRRHHPDRFYKNRYPAVVKTTIDASLQRDVQQLLDSRLRSLKARKINNGAVLIVDHTTGEVLAWVVAGSSKEDVPGYKIDAVTVPRQPGSVLKPFLYAAALEKGWSTTTLIDDSPLYEGVGSGLHHFKNYSNRYYGSITLREALANSLNIPAVRTIHYVGVKEYLSLLHKLGFKSLAYDYDIYDGGLALGNGEVSLLELVRAFVGLANRGKMRDLHFTQDEFYQPQEIPIFSEEVASLIGHILSDPWARRLEFSSDSVMNLPLQTAIKTGTSTDYRDAWVVGYNYRYVVGIWMGNLDNSPTDGITGSIGPTLTLRSIFSKLNRDHNSQGLYMSPNLIQRDVCIQTQGDQNCSWRTEYFLPGREEVSSTIQPELKLLKPTSHLRMALDPRIPRNLQKFQFEVKKPHSEGKIHWILDGKKLAETNQSTLLWPLERGKHTLKVIYDDSEYSHLETEEISFLVNG
ncbi:MAG TPA: transglycosylase domain-containing protein [Candidatus Nitrosotenuis sp.]|nr:transglycosylase domain-containing protein [Candidatus Nitrosotenuis sp.]